MSVDIDEEVLAFDSQSLLDFVKNDVNFGTLSFSSFSANISHSALPLTFFYRWV